MTLEELALDYLGALPGLVLTEEQATAMAVAAARFYAAYGDIRSVSSADALQETAGYGMPYPTAPDIEVVQRAALPIKNLFQIDEMTTLTSGEWAIIRPLFVLYAERGNATMIEATRGLGVDVFGRSVSEIAQEIAQMETITLPEKCFVSLIVEV